MQVAAMSPVAVDKNSVPAATVAKEKEIALEQTKNDPKNQGKPLPYWKKLQKVNLRNSLRKGTLLNQEFTKIVQRPYGNTFNQLTRTLPLPDFEVFIEITG